MRNNIYLALTTFFAVLLFQNTYAQDWVALSETEKNPVLKQLRNNNDVDGCHNLKYTLYNFSKNSTPAEITYGKQCRSGDKSIVLLTSHYLMYSDQDMVIYLDSSASTMNISYNNSLTSIAAEGFTALLESNNLVYKRKGGSAKQEIMIKSKESNDIDFYIIRFGADLSLKSLEINYEERSQQLYNMEPEVSKPILEIEFIPEPRSILEPMMDAAFFVELDERIMLPSKNFSGYTVNDARILSQTE